MMDGTICFIWSKVGARVTANHCLLSSVMSRMFVARAAKMKGSKGPSLVVIGAVTGVVILLIAAVVIYFLLFSNGKTG